MNSFVNAYTYEQISVGLEESFSIEITDRHAAMFREMTGDANPLHTDVEYAKLKGFPDKVVYGMLTASFLSTLAGMYLPGRNSIIHEVLVKFAKPCYADNGKLTVHGKCIDKQDKFKRIEVKVRITDAGGETVLRDTMKIEVRDE